MIFSICLLFISIAVGQDFIVTAQPGKIASGEVTRVTYQYKGETRSSIQLPDFIDFSIVSGPSRKQSVSIVNGRRSTSVEVSLDLIPRKTGAIKIPPATIQADGKTLTSNTLIIHVSTEKERITIPDKLNQDGVAITAEVNKDTLFQGEQAVITYYLLYSIDIQRYAITYEDDYDGCLRARFELDEPTQLDTINNKVYRRKVIARRSVFPYHEGQYTFDPMIINLSVPDASQRGRGFSFFSNPTKTLRLSSNQTEFYVRGQNTTELDSLLPVEGISMKLTLPDSSYTTDDLIPLRIQLYGNSDPSLLRAPILKTENPMYLPEPKKTSMNKSASTDGIQYLNTFDYYIQPLDTGTFKGIFFSPFIKKNGTIDTLYSRPFAIPITKGKYYDSEISGDGMTAPIKNNSWNYLLITIGLLVASIFLIFYLRKLKNKKRTSDKVQRFHQLKAKEIIENSLAESKQFIDSDAPEDAVTSLLRTLRQMAAGMTGKDIGLQYGTQVMYDNLRDKIDTENANEWKTYIQKLEQMQYGASPKPPELQHIYQEVADWVHNKFPFINDIG